MPCLRTCARSTPCSPHRSRVPLEPGSCSGTRTGTGRGCSRQRCGHRTSSSRSTLDPFRWRRPRSSGIGHGIDVSEFACTDAPPSGTVSLTALGRYSAAKGIDTMIHAVKRARAAGTDARLRAHGTSSHPGERENLERLAVARRRARAAAWIELGGPVPRSAIPGAARWVDRAREQHAPGRSGQGRLRGVRGLSAGARLEPVVRRAARRPSAVASLRARRRRGISHRGSSPLGALDEEERDRLGRTLRERVLDASLGRTRGRTRSSGSCGS